MPESARASFKPYSVEVLELERLCPTLIRVGFRASNLDQIGPARLDQRLKVFFPSTGREVCDVGQKGADGHFWYARWRALSPRLRTPFRTYTLHANSGARAEIIFVDHGSDSPAGRWLSTVRPGDRTVLVAPDITVKDPPLGIDWRPTGQKRYLVAGDETALPAIWGVACQVLNESDKEFYGLVETPRQSDALAAEAIGLPVRLGLPEAGTLAYVTRRNQDFGQAALGALATWAETQTRPEDIYVWLAGEAGFVAQARRYLTNQLGWPKTHITFTGYWKKGVAEN